MKNDRDCALERDLCAFEPRRLVGLLLVLACTLSLASAQAFFLPTGDDVYNTGDPRIKVDSRGNLHMIYPVVAGSGAVYAFCPAGCSNPEQVSTLFISTEEFGVVHTALVALDSADRPHILLATYETVHYGGCFGECRGLSDWRVAAVVQHGSDWELSGDSFTLDPQGRPHFLLHAFQAYLGLFGPDPGTRLYACASDCLAGQNWRGAKISEQSWLEPTLRFDARGVAHVATVIPLGDGNDLVAYLRCDGDCLNEQVDNWPGIGLSPAYSDRYIDEVAPAVSLGVTAAGDVRVAFVGEDGDDNYLAYFACDAACITQEGENWSGTVLSHSADGNKLGDGIDLVLDSQGNPRLVYTVSSSILLAHCNNDCAGTFANADWSLTKVELANEIPADDIFLYHNCTVGFWFLRQPSVALTTAGLPVVAYRAEDISAGWTSPDPFKPACAAGVDMTMSRLRVLGAY